ncbi:Peptidoglycan/xylan/chitin deacetylase, PgdA/CDA1 family [Lentzea fradiae]|uniref:Peptidoglycan/xylan/chitin deacetylase, PgdA/CDA1 family n=1 Tax=Lentzea fradiae TaxID=200378 RepID=A0A1G7NXF0_9PSEU|nr:polysaccharide deacetylase family protein [Lentzea fradiae]SDF78567.1 Peptidoglycan/xylan/chitin deacetylase, PgdA/CDA1 family [Lentzea fradiae]
MKWLRRKSTIVVAISLVVVLAAAVSLWNVSGSRTFQFFGEVVDRVDTDEKVIALTFDDGPHPAGTREVLDVLAEQQVTATFFLNGSDLAGHPDLGRAIVEAGHEVGNHTYHHRRMVGVLPGTVEREIEDTDARIRLAGYEGPVHFRPPYGKKLFALPHYLSEHDRKTITWDVEPDSEGTPPAERVVEQTLAETGPGSIILLHPMFPARTETRKALKPIITGLKERGYRFVTVSELLAVR